MPDSRITREPERAVVGGVCAGVASRYDYDLTTVRIVTVLIALASGGLAAAVYLAAWILMPPPGAVERPAADVARENVEDVAATARRAARELGGAARTATRAAREALRRAPPERPPPSTPVWAAAPPPSGQSVGQASPARVAASRHRRRARGFSPPRSPLPHSGPPRPPRPPDAGGP